MTVPDLACDICGRLCALSPGKPGQPCWGRVLAREEVEPTNWLHLCDGHAEIAYTPRPADTAPDVQP